MHRKKKLLIQVLLWTACVYHMLLGIIPFLPQKLALRFAFVLYGMDLDVTAQLSYIGKLFAMYAGIFGVFMGLAATDPCRYKLVIRWAALLFFARLLTNFVFFDYLRANFSMSPLRIWQCMIMLVFFGISLFILSGCQENQE